MVIIIVRYLVASAVVGFPIVSVLTCLAMKKYNMVDVFLSLKLPTIQIFTQFLLLFSPCSHTN